MLLFWSNPEFVRHRRAELRRGRAFTVAAVLLVLCVLIGLAAWASAANELEMAQIRSARFGRPTQAQLFEMQQRLPSEALQLFYRSLMYTQAGILAFWSLFSCAQAVSGERERKTWDFQRTTRLRPADLMLGKLLGEPVLAYFIVLCCLPIAAISGLAAKIGLLHVLSAYLLIVSSALFIGLAGLWLSSLFESRSRGVGLIGTAGLFAFLALSFNFRVSELPGLAGFSPLAGLPQLVEPSGSATALPTLFGAQIPWLLMSLLLYMAFGAWIALMLGRNLKKDYEEMRPLSRWQAVGCAAFLNFLLYALFHPHPWSPPDSHSFTTFIVIMNGLIILAVGVATLAPHERLRIWWCKRGAHEATLLSEDGPPWPWLVLSAVVAYALLIWGLFAWRRVLGFETSSLSGGAIQMAAVLIFVTRDVLFLQWCRLTRLRAPLIKGALYLCLYYIASLVFTFVFSVRSEWDGRIVYSLLTPAGALDGRSYGVHFPVGVFGGMSLQLIVVGVLVTLIIRRLKRPPLTAAVVGD